MFYDILINTVTLHEGAEIMARASKISFVACIAAFIIIVITLSGASAEMIIGMSGAGIVFIIGWNLAFLIEVFEKVETPESVTEEVG